MTRRESREAAMCLLYEYSYNTHKTPGEIVNAAVEDSGIYRMDAFDENGDMLLSMEIAARVIDDTVPKSGDSSLPVGAAFAVLAAASVALFVKLRRAA